MKKIALSLILLAVFSGSAMAGPLMALPVKRPLEVMPSSLFRDHELFFDLYGSYNKHWEDDCGCNANRDGYGGGLAVGYYFAYYVGARLDVNFTSVDAVKTTVGGDVMFRYPIPETAIAPYAFIGGGVVSDHGNHGFFRAGGGVEWRITPNFGLFTEGSYAWVTPDDEEQNLMVKVGVRLSY